MLYTLILKLKTKCIETLHSLVVVKNISVINTNKNMPSVLSIKNYQKHLANYHKELLTDLQLIHHKETTCIQQSY